MRDPYVLGRNDPTGVLDWLESRGHSVRAPKDMANDWNRPYPKCQLPSCGVDLIDRIPGTKFCSRTHKEQRKLELARAARLDHADETEAYIRALSAGGSNMALSTMG